MKKRKYENKGILFLHIPLDLQICILAFLKSDQIYKWLCVSKQFYKIITSNTLIGILGRRNLERLRYIDIKYYYCSSKNCGRGKKKWEDDLIGNTGSLTSDEMIECQKCGLKYCDDDKLLLKPILNHERIRNLLAPISHVVRSICGKKFCRGCAKKWIQCTEFNGRVEISKGYEYLVKLWICSNNCKVCTKGHKLVLDHDYNVHERYQWLESNWLEHFLKNRTM